VLLALISGNAFVAERPFYPADIATTLSSVPQPRALVTTPVHLRTLLASAVSSGQVLIPARQKSLPAKIRAGESLIRSTS
jgi:hypothetical protein